MKFMGLTYRQLLYGWMGSLIAMIPCTIIGEAVYGKDAMNDWNNWMTSVFCLSWSVIGWGGGILYEVKKHARH